MTSRNPSIWLSPKSILGFVLALSFLASVSFQAVDLVSRRQPCVTHANPEYDGFPIFAYSPSSFSDQYRPKGYPWLVHYLTLPFSRDGLMACKLLNSIVFVLLTVSAVCLLRESKTALLATLLVISSPKVLEYVVLAGTDFLATANILLALMLLPHFGAASTKLRAFLIGLGLAALAFFAPAIRNQSALSLLAVAFLGLLFLSVRRRSDWPQYNRGRLAAFFGILLAAALLGLFVFRKPGNWNNVALGTFDRFLNRIDTQCSTMDEAWFPQSVSQFLEFPDVASKLLYNWFFNLQQGLASCLFGWPYDLDYDLSTVYKFPPLLSFLLSLMTFAALGVWAKRQDFHVARRLTGCDLLFVLFFLAHLLVYLVFCLAFHLERFYLHVLPIGVYFLLRAIQSGSFSHRARQGLAAGLALACALAYGRFARVYLEYINPYSSHQYVNVNELDPDPKNAIFLSNDKRAALQLCGFTFMYQMRPEMAKLFLTREAAKNPAEFSVAYYRGGKEVHRIPLAQTPIRSTLRDDRLRVVSLDAVNPSGNVVHWNGKRLEAFKFLGRFDREVPGAEGWEFSGAAMKNQPTLKPVSRQYPVIGFVGKGLLNSFDPKEMDAPTGYALSPEFRAEKGVFLGFLVGGGAHKTTGVALLSGDGPVEERHGEHNEIMVFHVIDLAKWDGRWLRVKVFDGSPNHFGHVLADHFALYRPSGGQPPNE